MDNDLLLARTHVDKYKSDIVMDMDIHTYPMTIEIIENKKDFEDISSCKRFHIKQNDLCCLHKCLHCVYDYIILKYEKMKNFIKQRLKKTKNA